MHLSAHVKSMKKLHLTSLLLVALAFGIVSPASAASNHCTVQKGDSIWRIAERYNLQFKHLLELNKHHTNPHLIHPNDKVYLPNENTGTQTETHADDDTYKMKDDTPADSGDVSQQAQQVLQLVNAERQKAGLNALTLSDKLTDVAQVKAEDMAKNNYFSHTSPTYGSPFEMLQHFGISYKAAGENIAHNQRSAQEVMNAWMNSSGHRANILNANFTDLGVGYANPDSPYWVQEFISK